jgi:hypothetical protein
MKGGLRQKSKGFTVVETLIVLAITGGLFISAIVMMSGRQRQAEFNTAIRDVQSQLQQTISEVNDGFYPSRNNFTCVGEVTGPKLVVGAGKEQGSNEGCIFLGKVVHFGVTKADEPEEYPVLSVVGLRLKDGATGPEVTNVIDAKSRVIAPVNATEAITVPDVTSIKKLRGGLTVKWARVNGVNSASTNVGAVGFLSSLQSVSVGSVLKSGSQHIYALPLQGTALGLTDMKDVAKKVNEGMVNLTTKPLAGDSLQICIDSGTTKQSGLIVIGGDGRELSVDLRIQGALCSA